MKTEDLIEEVMKNIREDRAKASKVRDRLLVDLDSARDELDADNTMSIGSIAENVSTLTDVLTKMNAQIVELTKISQKRDTQNTEDDRSAIFDQIEQADATSDEN